MKVTLTREMVLKGRSRRGGWTRQQLQALGVKWPPRAGWLDALVGTEIPEAVYARFLSLQKDPPRDESENLAARYRKELGMPPLPGDSDEHTPPAPPPESSPGTRTGTESG